MPTPMMAVSSGSPAATREPKVMTRTTAEMMMPMISVEPPSGIAWRALPPVSTVSPASRPAWGAALRWSRVSSVSSLDFTL